MTQDLTQILKGQDPNDVMESIRRYLSDIESEKVDAAKSESENISSMTIEQLESEFESYDHTNQAYRYNIKHPDVARHNAVAAELNRKERIAHAQRQEVTMDKNEYGKQEVRRAMIETELETLRNIVGGSPNEISARLKQTNELWAEVDAMIKPVRLTGLPSTEPPPEKKESV